MSDACPARLTAFERSCAAVRVGWRRRCD